MEFVIYKFGGKTLKSPKYLNNLLAIVKKQTKKIIIVVSAIGQKGYPYATDTLLDYLGDNYLKDEEKDRYLGVGEIISSIVITNFLRKNGIKTISVSYLNLGIVCDKSYTQGNVIELNDEFYQQNYASYDVFIVPGFIAKTEDNKIITLGRNSSDYSAILLATLLHVNEVNMIKDVDGVYPYNANNFTKLKIYENLSYEEMLLLSNVGIKIVDDKALKLAKENLIKINIGNIETMIPQTIIQAQEIQHEVVGMNIVHNTIHIATFYPCKIKDELEESLRKIHLYPRDIKIDYDELIISVASSQLAVLKRLICKKYFICNSTINKDSYTF